MTRTTRTARALLAACLTTAAVLASLAQEAAASGTVPRTPFAATKPATRSCPAAPPGMHFTAPGAGRTVALTFDDGPGRDTGHILGILAHYRVTATFFNLGEYEIAHPDLVRAESGAGYALANHTWDHRSLAGSSFDSQTEEMTSASAAQQHIVGYAPCLFRPPYGAFDTTTLAAAANLRMRPWFWSVDTEDWKADGSADPYWVNRIVSRAVAGTSQLHPVVLMHNQALGNPATVAALPQVIAAYQRAGYRFVDLDGYTGPPAVRSVTPRLSLPTARTATGQAVVVAVRGSGFNAVVDVRFGGAVSTRFRSVTSTLLLVEVPRHTPGTVPVQVVTLHGTSPNASLARLTYTP